jgi:hypothetical protein
MASVNRPDGPFPQAVQRAIQDLIEQARSNGVEIVDVKREAARIRAIVPGADSIAAEDLGSEIVRQVSRLSGVGIAFDGFAD